MKKGTRKQLECAKRGSRMLSRGRPKVKRAKKDREKGVDEHR